MIIDLLTDSGTGAMSANQWGGIMRGDESYAGSPSFFHFHDSVHDIMGFEHVIPTHQGRAAERILFSVMCNEGDVVPNNSHFDTTRANVEFRGAIALDLPTRSDMDSDYPFKGDMDVEACATPSPSTAGAHPARHDHRHQQLRRRPAGLDGQRPRRRRGLPRVRHAALPRRLPHRRERVPHQAARARLRPEAVREIVREMCDLAEGCTMSAKKDAIVNMGGFLATRDADLAREEQVLLILTEGFPTYGGLSGRDLEALAIGMQEASTRTTSALHRSTHGPAPARRGVPLLWPTGGHAIYLDAKRFASHLAPQRLPGVAVANALYLLGGVRACEIGTLMFGHRTRRPARRRPRPASSCGSRSRAAPTRSHMDYVIEVVLKVCEERESLPGYRIVEQAPFLRHFSARLEPV